MSTKAKKTTKTATTHTPKLPPIVEQLAAMEPQRLQQFIALFNAPIERHPALSREHVDGSLNAAEQLPANLGQQLTPNTKTPMPSLAQALQQHEKIIETMSAEISELENMLDAVLAPPTPENPNCGAIGAGITPAPFVQQLDNQNARLAYQIGRLRDLKARLQINP